MPKVFRGKESQVENRNPSKPKFKVKRTKTKSVAKEKVGALKELRNLSSDGNQKKEFRKQIRRTKREANLELSRLWSYESIWGKAPFIGDMLKSDHHKLAAIGQVMEGESREAFNSYVKSNGYKLKALVNLVFFAGIPEAVLASKAVQGVAAGTKTAKLVAIGKTGLKAKELFGKTHDAVTVAKVFKKMTRDGDWASAAELFPVLARHHAKTASPKIRFALKAAARVVEEDPTILTRASDDDAASEFSDFLERVDLSENAFSQTA